MLEVIRGFNFNPNENFWFPKTLEEASKLGHKKGKRQVKTEQGAKQERNWQMELAACRWLFAKQN